MASHDYEYKGLLASSWDFLRGDTSKFPDRDFYRREIERRGEPAMILGCGTGRLLLDYLQEGLDVDGLDVSAEMLAICQTKASRLGIEAKVFHQAMEAMRLPRRYSCLIAPSSNFQLLADPARAAAALAGFIEHLRPGGVLIISIWNIQDGGDGRWQEWRLVADKEGFHTGKRIRRWERARFDPATRLRHTENRYELLEGDKVVYSEHHQRSPELRSYSISELKQLAAEAGFGDLQATSGFSQEPASEVDEVFCLMARKP